MANVKTVNISVAISVESVVRDIRKMEGYKAANAEYRSLSRVCKDIVELWTIDGKDGYNVAFESLGISREQVCPKVITQCHPDLSTMVDGVAREVIHKAAYVYELDEHGDPKLVNHKRVRKLDAEGRPVRELRQQTINGWNPVTLIQYLAEDRALRIIQYQKVVMAKHPKVGEKEALDTAYAMYADYVAAKFAPREEAVSAEKASKPKARRQRAKKAA